jgi:hypothetical protein
LGILVDSKLDVLGKRLVKFTERLLVLGNLLEHLNTLLDKVLADDLEDLVLLQHLSRNVEGQVLGIDNTLDKVEPLRDQVLAVVHDKHSTHIKLDVVSLLLLLKHVERRTLGDEEDRAELELSIDRRVLVSKVLFPIVGKGLVECTILLSGDIVGVSGPKWLGLQIFS